MLKRLPIELGWAVSVYLSAHWQVMWHYKGRWKYGPHKADMNTHADTTIPSRRMRSGG